MKAVRVRSVPGAVVTWSRPTVPGLYPVATAPGTDVIASVPKQRAPTTTCTRYEYRTISARIIIESPIMIQPEARLELEQNDTRILIHG